MRKDGGRSVQAPPKYHLVCHIGSNMACGTSSLSIHHHTPGIDTDDVRVGGGGAYDGVGWYSVVLVQHILSNATISSSGVVESPP